MEEAPRIVGIGELLWDILPSGPRLGGALANFAVMCARLGNRSALVSSIAEDDYGREARRLLSESKLDLEELQSDNHHPTGTVTVTLSEDKRPHYSITRNVAWDFIRLTPELVAATQTVDAVCYGTLAQRADVSRRTIRAFVDGTPPKCVRVCDINIRMPDCSAEVLYWSLAHATIIKVSEEELPLAFSFLAELGLASRATAVTAETATPKLLELFPECKLVAITLGPGGSLVTSREGACRHPGFPVEVVDTVGAGDAFTAGLLHAYLRGGSLSQMAEAGNLCGSYVASQPGATPMLPAEIIQRLNGLTGGPGY
ncbi:MAG TPA: carbohydrate kinase [Acidobacteriaceae bacterium]|nr:carbohydrate kinase [Acidobacteriaceae bacterium]